MPHRLEHLTSEDEAILRLESGPVVGHTLKVVLAERPRVRGDLLTALRRRVAAGVAREPRCTERLAHVPFELAPPAWVADTEFDVRRHVRRSPLTGIGREGLLAAAARSMEERLERDRPLWTIDLLEGVDRERVAYLVKVHHCMADGIASLRLAGQLLWDREVERAGLDSDGSGTPELVDKRPGAGRLLVSALRERVSGVHDTLVGAGKALLSRDARRADEAELERLPGTLRRELHATSARSPFDTAIGRRRTVGLVSWPLGEMRRVGHAHGATVNDVLLAAVGGGLRRWLAGRGQLLPDMRVKVPVSMHRDGEGPAALGNRDSFFCIDLPLHAANPGERLEAVRRETVERKRDHDAEVLYAFFNDLAHVSKRWYRRANAVASRPGVFSLCVSNLPGPQEQLDVLGGAIEEMYTLAEIGDRHGLRISVSSYHGRLSVGLCADALAVADIGALERSLEEELAELTRAASGPG